MVIREVERLVAEEAARELSVREMIHGEVRARLDELGEAEYRLPVEALALYERLTKDQDKGRSLSAKLWEEMALSIIQDDFVRESLVRRQRARQAMTAATNSQQPIASEELAEKMSGFAIWDGSKLISLMKAGKVELLAAANEKRQTNITSLTDERLYQTVAGFLTDDNIAEDVFTVEDIALMRADIKDQVTIEHTSWRPEFKRFKPRAFQDRKGAKD